MATKNSPSKAKTKTTKSKAPAQAAATKSRATKTTKTTVTKKTVRANSATGKIQVKANTVTMQTLRRLNLMAVIVFAALAVAAALLMNNTSYQLTIGHLAKDGLAEGTTLVPAIRAIYDVEVRWLVTGIMALSAVLPLLYVTKLEKRYVAFVQDTRMAPWRWFDLALTCAFMTETIALLSGVHDLAVLKLVGGMVAVTCILGLIAERQNNAAAKPVWSAYLTSLVSGVLPWKLIAAYAVATVVYGSARAPWFVYAVYGTTLVGFCLFAFNQYKQYRGAGRWQDYVVVERNYLAVNLLTKVAFAGILIAGLR